MARSQGAAELIAAGIVPLDPDDIARAAQFMLEQPEACAISEMVVRPARQAF